MGKRTNYIAVGILVRNTTCINNTNELKACMKNHRYSWQCSCTCILYLPMQQLRLYVAFTLVDKYVSFVYFLYLHLNLFVSVKNGVENVELSRTFHLQSKREQRKIRAATVPTSASFVATNNCHSRADLYYSHSRVCGKS